MRELWRFYQAAVLNTLFGFGLYALLIACGVYLYFAQAIAFVSGVIFNYFMYSRHVFPSSEAAKTRFILAYGANYLLNLGLLWIFDQLIVAHDVMGVGRNYVVGFTAAILASIVNYVALKYLVFARRSAA